MRILTVVGARPQFVKAALLSQALASVGATEMLVDAGQHYDANMSSIFFEELRLPVPHASLGVGSGTHAVQTGEIMRRLEPVVQAAAPDWLVVFGDTNTTLAGGIVGAKLHVPVAHVEAGIRSFNRSMPEEINRIAVDHVSDLLLAPSEVACRHLSNEGLGARTRFVGDIMVDLAFKTAAALPARPPLLEKLDLEAGAYGVVTIHRPSNTDDAQAFRSIIDGLRTAPFPLLFPVHPRTRALMESVGTVENIRCIDPVSYNEMIALMKHARAVFTDSGGMQKEAFVLRVPCITLRRDTEWPETVESGWNVLVGSDTEMIQAAMRRPVPRERPMPYGDGTTAQQIVSALSDGPPGRPAPGVLFVNHA